METVINPVRVQAIRSKGQQLRLYVTIPQAIAAAISLVPGETVQWELLDRGELHLVRQVVPESVATNRSPRNPTAKPS